MVSDELVSRNAALRVALAARVLPGVSAAHLVGVLHQRLNGNITEDKLKKVSVTDIKAGLSEITHDVDLDVSAISADAMKEAVRTLWGEKEPESLPTPQPIEEVPPRSVRVALSSNTGEKLDGHFGSCLRYLVYQVTEEWCQLIDIRSAVDADSAEDKNLFRAQLIKDCQVVYLVSVGGPAAAKIVHNGIYPLKKPNGGDAKDIIAELQTVMRTSPPPWLAKILGDSPEQRIRFETDELEEAD